MHHYQSSSLRRRSHLIASWLCLLVLSGGCGQPKLGAPAYTLAVGLDRILEKRDMTQLARAAERLQLERVKNAITEREAEILSVLIERAKGDGWEDSRSRLRSLLTAQVNW